MIDLFHAIDSNWRLQNDPGLDPLARQKFGEMPVNSCYRSLRFLVLTV